MSVGFEDFKKILTAVVLLLLVLVVLLNTTPSDSSLGKAIDFLRPEKTQAGLNEGSANYAQYQSPQSAYNNGK